MSEHRKVEALFRLLIRLGMNILEFVAAWEDLEPGDDTDPEPDPFPCSPPGWR